MRYLYDPATGNWTRTGDFNYQQMSHAVSVLKNEKVLVTGGYYFSNDLNFNDCYPM